MERPPCSALFAKIMYARVVTLCMHIEGTHTHTHSSLFVLTEEPTSLSVTNCIFSQI